MEIHAEGWGGEELVATNQDAQQCNQTSMLSGDSYTTYSTKRNLIL